MINNQALLDYASAACLNLWAEENKDRCTSPSTTIQGQTAAEAYKVFTDAHNDICMAALLLVARFAAVPPQPNVNVMQARLHYHWGAEGEAV